MNVTYTFAKNLFSEEKIKELNEKINKNFIKSEDSPASDSIKTSSVKFLKYSSIKSLIIPFVEFCYKSNEKLFGLDLYSLKDEKLLNYNIYEAGTEYNWHVDAVHGMTSEDIKLTCLLNCSKENYSGGDLSLFLHGETKCNELNKPGSAVVFPSFINHKVDKLLTGRRHTLAIWMYGPRFK